MSSDSTLKQETTLTKAALLYADHVTLISPAATMFASLDSLRDGSPEAMLQLIAALPAGTLPGLDDSGTRAAMAAIAQGLDPALSAMLTASQRREWQANLAEARAELESVSEEMRRAVAALSESAQADGLNLARDQGLVSVADLTPMPSDGPHLARIEELLRSEGAASASSDDATGQMVEVMAARIFSVLSEGKSLPVFDDDVAALVRSGVSAARPTEAALRRARHGGLAAGIVKQLPAFPLADMSDVLDVRKELAGPLVNFRAAVLQLSKEMETEAYDEEFDAYLSELWMEKIDPELKAIEAAVRENKYLRQLMGDLIKPSPAIGAASSIATMGLHATIGLGGAFGAAAAGLLAVGALGQPVMSAGLTFSKQSNENEQRQFWFLYAANQQLTR